MKEKKVAFVTGASSGIELDTAMKLIEKGFTVYGAARRTVLMEPLLKKGGKTMFLDLTDAESVRKCVQEVIETEGRIDVLINNSGYGLGGGIENVSIEDAKRQFDVNVFGLAEITRLFLPYMRAQHSGTIINISSMAGRFSSPFLGWYHASKYAVEALSDSLRMELRPFGINVVIIEPGLIKTDWGVITAQSIRKQSGDTEYAKNASGAAEYYEKHYCLENSSASNPDVVSKTIVRAACKKHPRSRYLTGKNAVLFVLAKKTLPDKIYDAITCLIMGQKKIKER